MATHEYVIRIENNAETEIESPVASSAPNENKATKNQKEMSTSGKAATFIASKAVSPAVKSVTTHITSSVGISTGSQELQQKTDLAVSLFHTASGALSSAFSAAALFGPAGFAVGIATSLAGVAVQYGIKQSQVAHQMRVEEEQLALYRSRFGAGFNGSRTGGA